MAGEKPDAAFSLFVAAGPGARRSVRWRGPTRHPRGHGASGEEAGGQPCRAARRAERSGQPVANSGAVAAGDRLTLEMIRKFWGVSADDVRKLLEIADAEDVLITSVREPPRRSSWSATRRVAEAEAMKIKSIDQIDIDHLGYRRTRKGRVELVEPPKDLDIEFSLPKDELAAKAKMSPSAGSRAPTGPRPGHGQGRGHPPADADRGVAGLRRAVPQRRPTDGAGSLRVQDRRRVQQTPRA